MIILVIFCPTTKTLHIGTIHTFKMQWTIYNLLFIALIVTILSNIQFTIAIDSKSKIENPSIPELASLASHCLNVVKSELKNRDMPVVFLFIGMTEQVISAIAGNTTMGPNNSSFTIQPNMCDWDDPESRTER